MSSVRGIVVQNYRTMKSVKIVRVKGSRKNKTPKVRIQPPPFTASKSLVQNTYRFQAGATNGVNEPVTVADLFNLVCMALTTTTSARLCDAVRLRSVEIWSPPQGATGQNTTSITYRDPAAGPGTSARVVSDTSLGADKPSHVHFKPPNRGVQQFWLNPTSSDTILLLTFAEYAVVDVKLSQVIQNGDSAPVSAGVLVGATAGRVYTRALDVTAGSSLLVPVSAPTI